LEEEEDIVKASKVNFESIENARSWWCLLPNTAWFIRNLLLPLFWTENQISTVEKTFLRSFHHLWDRFTNHISTVDIRLSWEVFIISEIDLQIRSQP
jgi:hypothetical protein